MARIRTIKPEFWSSPSHRYADPWVRLFFQSMWNWADDTGRGTANPRELAAFAFPDDEDPTVPTVDDVPRLLLEVHKRYDVVFYKVDGRRYYEIPSWDRHQRNERKAASRHPGPEDGSPYDPGPGDGAFFTESRKFRDSATEAAGTVRGGGSGGPRKADRRQSLVDRAVITENDHPGEPQTPAEQQEPPLPSEHHGTSVHGDGGSALGTGEPGTGEPGASCDSGSFELALVDAAITPSALTPNQRAKKLADVYCGLVKLASFMAVRAVVRKAVDHYADEQIEPALRAIAAEKGRPLTETTLRIAIEGFVKFKPTTDDNVAGALKFLRAEDETHYRGTAS